MSECEPVSLAKHRPFLDGCSAKIRSPQRGMRDSLLPGNSRGVVEQVQVRVTASPRRMVPPLSTDAYTPTFTALCWAAVRRIPESLGRSSCGRVIITHRGQGSVMARRTVSPIARVTPGKPHHGHARFGDLACPDA
jgi:hypothetical protein